MSKFGILKEGIVQMWKKRGWLDNRKQLENYVLLKLPNLPIYIFLIVLKLG